MTPDEARLALVHELVLGQPAGQDRAGRPANHFLGNAAQEYVLDPAPAVGAHDNEVDAFRADVLQDLRKCDAGPDRRNPSA